MPAGAIKRVWRCKWIQKMTCRRLEFLIVSFQFAPLTESSSRVPQVLLFEFFAKGEFSHLA